MAAASFFLIAELVEADGAAIRFVDSTSCLYRGHYTTNKLRKVELIGLSRVHHEDRRIALLRHICPEELHGLVRRQIVVGHGVLNVTVNLRADDEVWDLEIVQFLSYILLQLRATASHNKDYHIEVSKPHLTNRGLGWECSSARSREIPNPDRPRVVLLLHVTANAWRLIVVLLIRLYEVVGYRLGSCLLHPDWCCIRVSWPFPS